MRIYLDLLEDVWNQAAELGIRDHRDPKQELEYLLTRAVRHAFRGFKAPGEAEAVPSLGGTPRGDVPSTQERAHATAHEPRDR
jgi:hypothetical protein